MSRLRRLLMLAIALLMVGVSYEFMKSQSIHAADVEEPTPPVWTDADPFYKVLMEQGVVYETGRPTKGPTRVEILSVLPHYNGGDVAPPRNRTESTFEIAVTTIYTVPIAFVPQ